LTIYRAAAFSRCPWWDMNWLSKIIGEDSGLRYIAVALPDYVGKSESVNMNFPYLELCKLTL